MKTKLHSLFIGLVLTAGILQASAQVTNLGIAPAGRQSILYWPASTTNYALQTTPNLATPNWVTASSAITVNAVTVTNSAPAGYFRLLPTTNPPGMVLIPAGPFLMGNSIGDADNGDAIPTNVYVSAFFMDTNLVTYSVWQSVYTFATTYLGYGFDNAGLGKAANHPVRAVNWYDCVKWCNARSQLAGLTPVYYTDAGFTQVYKAGQVDAIFVKGATSGFRLPTEAEWEKAARGGLSGRRFPWGNLISEGQANYYGNTNLLSYDFGPNGFNAVGSIGGTTPATSPVGSFDVNGYGLYDMAGNVYAWCWDWYATPYGQPTTTNPTGAATGFYRVVRGGSWNGYAAGLKCAIRAYNDAFAGNGTYGFRCVRGL